eukprot:jgi/Chlat1/1927/Chrsp153S02238
MAPALAQSFDARLPAIATLLQIFLLTKLGYEVGLARRRHGVKPPATSGAVEFERAFRAHANQVEQSVPFLSALWVFSYYVDPTIGGAAGLLWLALRWAYAYQYARGAGLSGSIPVGIVAFTTPAYLIIMVMTLWALVKIIRSYLH